MNQTLKIKRLINENTYSIDAWLTLTKEVQGLTDRPDIWYEIANYLFEHSKQLAKEGKQDEACKYVDHTVDFYEQAIKSYMQNSLLIHFAYAGFQEEISNLDKSKEIFDKCLQNQLFDVTLVIIQYMRFMNRTKGIKAAREIFKIGREDPRTTYHLYVAAADMEYLCTKDKSVAFKIFQLGAKKYPNSVEFMLAYIKYMSHLNEDNNTRVLFERIISSNDLPKDGIEEIWSEFLKFECYCGDLSSILKVDKKRQKILEMKDDVEKNETSLVIDRYTYLDLLPCSAAELKTLGYMGVKTTNLQNPSIVNSKSFTSKTSNSNIIELQFKNDPKIRLKYSSPDETQMLPFKPVRNAFPGMHAVNGGIFPFPPLVSELVKKLPPPHLFQGPFVIIDNLLKSFMHLELVEHYQPLYVYISGEPMKDIGSITANQNAKRLLQNQADSDEEDTKKNKSDIFTQRLHKKFSRLLKH